MIDKLSKEHRSWNMSRIKGRDTKPELQFRKLLHRAGFRFRLHDKTIPGKPDIVLKKYRSVIFVHGCFWHRHTGCKEAAMPKSRTEFWSDKFTKTVERDNHQQEELNDLGWNVIIVWECELKKDADAVLKSVANKLAAGLTS